MKSAIEEIYENAWELLEELPHSEEYERIKREQSEQLEALEKTLDEAQKQLLEKLYFFMSGLECEASKTHFIAGFNYGVRIVAEALK